MKAINIVIADDHPIYRNGIAGLLSRQQKFKLVGEADDGEELLELVEKHRPDVVITDIRMPRMDGIAATKRIVQKYPDTKVLALSMHDEEKMINAILKAGAIGYLLKNTDKEELLSAITSVVRGEMFFNRHVSSHLLSRFMNPDVIRHQQIETGLESNPLTDREIEVLKLIVGEELTNEKIAQRLHISKRTVDTHRKNLLLKLGVHNTVGLVKFAYRLGLVEM